MWLEIDWSFAFAPKFRLSNRQIVYRGASRKCPDPEHRVGIRIEMLLSSTIPFFGFCQLFRQSLIQMSTTFFEHLSFFP